MKRKAAARGSRRPDFDALDHLGRVALPACLEHRVGMQEQEPRKAGARRAGPELVAAARLALHDLGAGMVGDLERAVARAAVDDDDLAHEPLDGRRDERGERAAEVVLGVERGDDDGNHAPLWHGSGGCNKPGSIGPRNCCSLRCSGRHLFLFCSSSIVLDFRQ